MPNWVCNHLIIHGENAVEVMNSLLSENSESENGYDVDFNKIIPMPEDLKIESGSVTRDCAKLYVNAMLEGCDAYKKYAALYVQAFGKDLAMSEDEQRKTMEYVMLHKDYEKNCPMFQTKADAYAYGKKALDNYEKYGAKDWYGHRTSERRIWLFPAREDRPTEKRASANAEKRCGHVRRYEILQREVSRETERGNFGVSRRGFSSVGARNLR